MRRQAPSVARAERAADDRAGGDERRRLPVDTGATNAKTMPDTRFTSIARRFLIALTCWRSSRKRHAEDAEQQDPLRRAEVAAVDARCPNTSRRRDRARAGRRAGRRAASRFASRGWRTMSTSAMTMNTGTIASNADAGQLEQRDRAHDAAGERRDAELQEAVALRRELAPVADDARERARDEPDRVGDVRGDRARTRPSAGSGT